jgi:ATP-dependent RNA helicase SUPV3L1/SUV3
VDSDALRDEREKTADLINMILLHNLKNNIRFCDRCGAAMPLHHSGRLCNDCFARIRRSYSRKGG